MLVFFFHFKKDNIQVPKAGRNYDFKNITVLKWLSFVLQFQQSICFESTNAFAGNQVYRVV